VTDTNILLLQMNIK